MVEEETAVATTPVTVKTREHVENSETRLRIIKQMQHHAGAVSMYRIAQDLHTSSAKVHHHVAKLVEEGMVTCTDAGYVLNECLMHLDEHIEMLAPLVVDVACHNPAMTEEQLTTLLTYILTLMTIEVG
jgi:DNA-binding IclR family transcriptional regulator